MITVNISQNNVQENITSRIISKMYNVATDTNNTVTFSGNLYSPSGYIAYVQYLTRKFSPNLTITVPENGQFLSFVDGNVESIIKTLLGIQSGYGITVNDAANATFTSNTFQNNTNIRSFPEFNYFTKANNNPPANLFKGCSNLDDIDISNITAISVSEFEGCSSLWGDLSFQTTTLGGGAFRGCSSITSLDFSGSIFLSVDNNVFRDCSNLEKLILPTTVAYLGNTWYPSSTALTIEGLDNVSSHHPSSWQLDNRNILNPIKTSLQNGQSLIRAVGNNKSTSIPMLFEPSRTETFLGSYINGYRYYNSHFEYGNNSPITIGLLYYKDITSFGHCTFAYCNIQNLVINNTTPPTFTPNTDSNQTSLDYYGAWSDTPFGHIDADSARAVIGTLWVPNSAKATYQANSLYSSLTIKGIDDQTNGVYDLPRYATYADWKTAEAAAVAQGGHAPQGLIEAWM